MSVLPNAELFRGWLQSVRAETVAFYGSDNAGVSGFRVVHDRALHRPWGLFRVYQDRVQVGAMLSYPCYDDCLVLLEQHARSLSQAAAMGDRRGRSALSIARRRAARRGSIRSRRALIRTIAGLAEASDGDNR